MDSYVIETKGLTKRFGGQTAVSDLNLHVREGRIYGLLGRNGAGKSTTMKLLLGLLAPSKGSVSLFGKELSKNERALLPRVGSSIESPGFYPNLTGTENLRIFAKLRGVTGRNAVQEALEVVNLPYRDKKLFSQYSLGMKQRLALALAMMHDPELLILDEPTNGLDPIGIAEIRSFLKALSAERGKTILLSSHILPEISALADDIGIIDHGVLLAEEDRSSLEKKTKKRIQIGVQDAAAAAMVMETKLHLFDFDIIDDHHLWLYDFRLPAEELSRALVQNHAALFELYVREESLEDYFREITGGSGIA